jgi:uncharacterized MAPEG superfamily protein
LNPAVNTPDALCQNTINFKTSEKHAKSNSVTMNFLWTTNISLYTVPAAYILCVAPHIYKVKLYESVTGIKSSDSASRTTTPQSTNDNSTYFFNKTQPRTFLATVNANPHPNLTPAVKARLARAEAASLNGYENIGFFAAAVTAANLTIVVVHANRGGEVLRSQLFWTNVASLGYVAMRVMFNVEYVRGVRGFRRGGWFWMGWVCVVGMYVSAGNAMRVLVQ